VQGCLKGQGLACGFWEHRWNRRQSLPPGGPPLLCGCLDLLDALEDLDDVAQLTSNCDADAELLESPGLIVSVVSCLTQALRRQCAAASNQSQAPGMALEANGGKAWIGRP